MAPAASIEGGTGATRVGASSVKIGERVVGPGHPPYIVAEIGINHNGVVDLAIDMIKAAAAAGCDAVKFQKRTVDLVYTPEQLAMTRPNPYGRTNGELKRGLEIEVEDWCELGRVARKLGMELYASCWDERSVDDLDPLSPAVYKIGSPCLTDRRLLEKVRSKGKPVILSTGMSEREQIDEAVEQLGHHQLILLYCKSIYPLAEKDVNLRTMLTLASRFPGVPVGYSAHQLSIYPSLAAVALGACMIEHHFSLSRELWGSDQATSLEPHEMRELVEACRTVHRALGDGEIHVLPGEVPAREKLRFRR